MKQVYLRCKDTYTFFWVDDQEGVKKGNFLTLKDDDRRWEIVEVYDTSIEKKEINRTWHVGGL